VVKGFKTRHKVRKRWEKALKRFQALRKRLALRPNDKSLSRALDKEHHAAARAEAEVTKSQDRAWARIDKKR
jgi:hypothetical protein